jgi:hypothetical protein
MACRKVRAVTGSPEGGEKRKPARMVIVSREPSSATLGIPRATSGMIRAAAAPGAST